MTPYTVPPVFDLLIYAGDTFTMAATVTQGGVPFNLTGYTAAAQIRATPTAAVLAAMAATIAANVITLNLTAADTAALPAAVAVWDLRITSPVGAVTTLLAGDAKVTPSVTR